MTMLSTIDHELLRTFVAIVDQGGFTRAAQTVNRTQSAVSMQIKRLEEDVIQRPLFVRQSKPLQLTSEGHTLLGYARRILDLQGEALNVLRQPDMVGRVRLGVPDDYVMRFLPGVLQSFSQAWPMVDVDVHCAPSSVLLQQQDEQLDLSIVTREVGNEIGTILRREKRYGYPLQAIALTWFHHYRLPCSKHPASAAATHAMRLTARVRHTGLPTAAQAWPRFKP